DFLQGRVVAIIANIAQQRFSRGKVVRLHRQAGLHQRRIAGVAGAAIILAHGLGQFGGAGAAGLAVLFQHAFEHALVDRRGIAGLVLLVVGPAIPAEHPGQRQDHTGQHGHTVAMPDVLDPFYLFFFCLVTHPALLYRIRLIRRYCKTVRSCSGTASQANVNCSPSPRRGLKPTWPAAASASPRISAYSAPDLSAFLNWLLKLPPPQCTTRRIPGKASRSCSARRMAGCCVSAPRVTR